MRGGCRLLPPEKKNYFYFRYTLLRAAKRPSCQAISEVISVGSSGGLHLFHELGFNSSNVTGINEVSEVDGKTIFDQETTEVEELEKKTWHLR